MKYIISESQYKILLREDRVEYLRTQNVIRPNILDQSVEGENEREDERPEGGMRPNRVIVEPIEAHNGIDIAYKIIKKGKQTIKLSNESFQDIVDADPSGNKQYVQWMIQVFLKHIKDNDIEQAIRFISEDLPEVTEFLGVFDSVKNKKVFKRSAPNRPNAPQDVTNINQYNDLAHLYSVVSPFIGVDDDEEDDGESKLWKRLKKYIDLGEARLAYRDNDVLIYTPLTVEASCDPLGPLASWCTRREGNSYFDSYRRNNPKPDGSLSDYYVIMPKNLFDGDDEGSLYPLQFHFESNQIHDKNNSSIEKSDKLNSVLGRFPGMKDFFKKELGALVEMDVRKGMGLMESPYIKYLNMFGGKAKDHISGDAYEEGVKNIKKMASEQNVALQNNKYLKWLMENTDGVNVVDYLDKETTTKLDFSNLSLGKLPDLSEFKNLVTITATNCGLTVLPPVNYLPSENLQTMSFNNNQITVVPLEGYSTLDEVFIISLLNNPINKINVPELKKMVDFKPESGSLGLVKFSIDTSVVENLSPENKKQWEDFMRTEGAELTLF